ncbi:gliding motility-associated C-terminal domain-containing protein [Halosquirtibacter laminarini]|uniref:Gliding motility-associated C-terminal domain-containing protein n=1 Tax=Halosquirtibacter laminarini TaxID=3374600 RepID=A0AC61NDV8_9BACT|nr:gliding motility-associated C-terminal domain-containing protein [Prolixibacteraceae bacterium]
MKLSCFKIWTLCILWIVTLGVGRAQTPTPDVTVLRGSVHRFKAAVAELSYTYKWSIRTLEGKDMNYKITSDNETTELIYFYNDGTYEISVTPTERNNGCLGETTTIVVEVGMVTQAKIIASKQDGFRNAFMGSCEETIELDGSKSSGEHLRYEWGPKKYFSNPYQSKVSFIKGNTTGTVKVWLEVVDKDGSRDREEKDVVIDPEPEVRVEGASKVLPDSWIVLDGSSSVGNNLLYFWSNKDPEADAKGKVDATDPSKLIVYNAGTYVLRVVDRNGCKSEVEYDVISNGTAPITKEDIGTTREMEYVDFQVLNNDYDLENDMDTTSLKIYNKPLHGKAEYISKNLIRYTPDEYYIGEDQFEYEICDLLGNCSTEFVKILTKAGHLTVVRGFSPNNDGINDRFRVKAITACEKSEIHIYNRFGDLVYQNNRYGLDGETSWWDGIATEGQNKGSEVNPGTYYYILKTDKYPVKKGYVYISR